MKKLLVALITSFLCLSLTSTVLSETGDFYVDGALVNEDFDTYLNTKVFTNERKIDRTVYITLANDIDLNINHSLVIKDDCSVEIDLNGHNIKNSILPIDKPLIENEGVLTIIDKTGLGKVYVDIDNYQNSLILNKGTFCLEKAELSIINADADAVIINNGQEGLNKNTNTYINNGTISTNSSVAIRQCGYSDSYDSFIRIKGGSISASSKVIETINNNDSYKTSLIIDGGSFDGLIETTSSQCVYNAIFKTEISDDLIANGFSQSKKDDNHFIVSTNYEAKIDDNYYENIADAVNKASAGQIITLLKDVTHIDVNVVVPSEVTLDLNGHRLKLNTVSYFGYIHDSSEIIDDVLYFYGRPQGSMAIQEETSDGKHLLRNLNSASTTVGSKYKLPVYNKKEDIYKFYTLSDITYGLKDETKPEDFRFRPIIGFSPNSIWKEILNDNTYIKIGSTISLVSEDDTKHYYFNKTGENNSIYVYYDSFLKQFADYSGYGRFILKFAFNNSRAPSCIYTVRPVVYDSYNNYAYYSNGTETHTILNGAKQ